MFRIDSSADTCIRLRLTDIVSSTRCSDVDYTAIHVMADKSYPFLLFSSPQFSRAGAFCYRTRSNINNNCLCAINVDVFTFMYRTTQAPKSHGISSRFRIRYCLYNCTSCGFKTYQFEIEQVILKKTIAL